MAAYIPLEWIETDGHSIFDTGILGLTDIEIEAVIAPLTMTEWDAYRGYFGVDNQDSLKNGSNFYVRNYIYSLNPQLTFGTLNERALKDYTFDLGVFKTWIYNNHEFSIDGQVLYSFNATIDPTYAKTIYIGGFHNADPNDPFRAQQAKYGEFIIRKNGIIVGDFVPAKTINGDVGFFDKISGNFSPNLGDGTPIPGPVAHTFTPSKSSFRFESTGGTDTFTVNAETTWSCSTPEFATISPMTGDTGETTVTISVPEWTGDTKREEIITFTDADDYSFDIKINQKRVPGEGYSSLFMGEFNCDTMYFGEYQIEHLYLGETEVFSSGPFVGLKITGAIAAPKDAGQKTLSVKSSEDWTLTLDPTCDWITLSQTTGTIGKTSVALSIDDNESGDIRTAGITATTNNYSATCVITQSYIDWVPITANTDRSKKILKIRWKNNWGQADGYFSELPNINLDNMGWSSVTGATYGYGGQNRFNATQFSNRYYGFTDETFTNENHVTRVEVDGQVYYEFECPVDLYWGGFDKPSVYNNLGNNIMIYC